MRNTIDNRMLDIIPLVERTMEVSDNELFIVYTVVGDLDFDITLKKKYASYEKLERSVILFLSNEKDYKDNVLIWNCDFSIQQEKAKKELFFRFDNGKLLLPDNGDGFIFDGDLDYMRSWINKL